MGKDDKNSKESLRSLIPINGLSPQYQREIIHSAQVLAIRKGRYVFKEGDKDNHAYYLLEGELAMFAEEQLTRSIAGGTPEANSALAQLQPRQLSARANSRVKVLQVDRVLLDKLLTLDSVERTSSEVEVSDIDGQEASDWMTRVLQSEIFAAIPITNIQQILERMEVIEVKAGEVVLKQGATGDYYYVIDRGCCIVSRTTSNGRAEAKLAELRGGESFGEEALVSGAKRNATVTMRTDGVLLRLTKKNFVSLIKKPLLKKVLYADARQMVDDGAVWLDVRLEEEYINGALPKSVNIPLNLLRSRIKSLPKSHVYLVYCDTGVRSPVGTLLLKQRGYDVSYLAGGLVRSPEAGILGVGSSKRPTVDRNERSDEKAKQKKGKTRNADKGGNVTNAAVRASSLKAELAKANLELENALRCQTDAERAKEHAEQTLEIKLRMERKKLMNEVERTRQALEDTRNLQGELLAVRQAAEAKAVEIARKEEQQKRAEDQTERRLRLHREKLATETARNLQALKRIQGTKEVAVQRLRDEKKRLNGDARMANKTLKKAKRNMQAIEIAKREADQEVERRYHQEQARIKKMGKKSEKRLRETESRLAEEYVVNGEELAGLEGSQGGMERQGKAQDVTMLRQAVGTRLREEKQDLERQFVRNIKEIDNAQREYAGEDAARKAADTESEKIIAECRAVSEVQNEKMEGDFPRKNTEIRKEGERIEAILELARREREEAQTALQKADYRVEQYRARRKPGAALTDELLAEIEAIEEEIYEANERLETAELELEEAEKIKLAFEMARAENANECVGQGARSEREDKERILGKAKAAKIAIEDTDQLIEDARES